MQTWPDGYPFRVTTALAGGDIRPPRRCRYPIGGEGADTRFCDGPVQRGRSYCPRHARRCVVSVDADGGNGRAASAHSGIAPGNGPDEAG